MEETAVRKPRHEMACVREIKVDGSNVIVSRLLGFVLE